MFPWLLSCFSLFKAVVAPKATAPPAGRENLLSLIRGQSMTLPDIEYLLRHWPQSIHPELDRLYTDIELYLEGVFPAGKRLQKLKAAKIPLLGASWLPDVSYQALTISTYLLIWVFVWDDEMDSLEFSSIVADPKQAKVFRTATIEYIRACLDGDDIQAAKISSNPIITSFKPVGDAVASSCTNDQIAAFLSELELFVYMTGVEQLFQQEKMLPTVEEYQERRMGSSSVGALLSITEYAYDIDIPINVIKDHDVRILIDEANTIVSVTNDILSIKKEVAQGQVDSLIPLLYLRHGSLQVAVDSAMSTLRSSVVSLESAAERLKARYLHDERLTDDLMKYIESIKRSCTASLNWRLVILVGITDAGY
ncbi:isoprenoid synthase domain-containing protein [Tricladium varicosporioides]|nr:isoprenoid synthase domain-containing protein [Hymenoscyphus varicosporioides]